MERRMRLKSHVRCGAGEKLEIISKIYLSLLDCGLWNNVAESTSEYCSKGDLLGVKGRIQTRKYETEDEKVKHVTEFIAEKVTFLSSNRKNKETE